MCVGVYVHVCVCVCVCVHVWLLLCCGWGELGRGGSFRHCVWLTVLQKEPEPAALSVAQLLISRVGQNHIYIRCTYGIFGLEITKYTVYIHVYIRFWPTLLIRPLASNAICYMLYVCYMLLYVCYMFVICCYIMLYYVICMLYVGQLFHTGREQLNMVEV